MKKIITLDFINQLEAMVLNMNQPMKGFFGGIHKTKEYGSTVEFADFREYVLGDDIRRIDWNLYSRFEKHFIKLYNDEKQMHIQIFLDCSSSMSAIEKKKEATLKIAASLGYLSVHNLDKLSINLIEENGTRNINGIMSGKEAFYQTIPVLEEANFGGDADIENAIINCPTMGYNDGLTIIISDFLTDNNWKNAVDYLLYRHREVMLVHILSIDELNPAYNGRMYLMDAEASDKLDFKNLKMKISKSEFEVYQKALDDYLEDIKKFCIGRQLNYIFIKSEDEIEKALFEQLYERGVVK